MKWWFAIFWCSGEFSEIRGFLLFGHWFLVGHVPTCTEQCSDRDLVSFGSGRESAQLSHKKFPAPIVLLSVFHDCAYGYVGGYNLEVWEYILEAWDYILEVWEYILEVWEYIFGGLGIYFGGLGV